MNFITIDFETANQYRNSAISVGLVSFINGEPCEIFYSLIKPPFKYFEPDFFDIHGLTYDDVKDAPSFDTVWKTGIAPFIQKHVKKTGCEAVFVAHNASFDMSVLRKSLEHYNIELPAINYVCSLRVAQKTWKHFPEHKLTYLAKNFGIKYEAHNALEDALTCGKILCIAGKEIRIESIAADTRLYKKHCISCNYFMTFFIS